MENDDEIRYQFLEESTSLLEEAFEAAKTYKDSTKTEQIEKVNMIYRAVHTIKGGAGMLDLNVLSKIAHEFENNLTELKKKPESVDVEIILNELDALEIALQNEFKVDVNLVSDNPAKEIQNNQDELSQKTSSSNLSQKKEAPNVIRVPLDRIQRSYDITSEIFLLRNQMAHLLESASKKSEIYSDLFLKWEVLDNSLRQHIVELESSVLSMRMASIKSLFLRMEKTIRSYSTSVKKEITTKIIGEETEIDKRILDSLGDVLIHLVRNAMDHGIELPDTREKYHKPRCGSITLEAKVIGNEAIINIHDDGKGIDIKSLINSAREKGIDVSHMISDQDALQLIFAPGFSTAKNISDVSGRGIGMDAVKTYVEKSGGKILVETKVGAGTTFSLHLPIGLSIIPLIVLRVGKHIYGIPTHDIIQTYTMCREDVLTDQNLINIDDRYIRCIFLSKCFDRTDSQDILMRREIFVCVANVNDQLCAFIADELIANTELIVKSLPPVIPNLPYLQGASILTTGAPAFILSLEKLYKHLRQNREVERYV